MILFACAASAADSAPALQRKLNLAAAKDQAARLAAYQRIAARRKAAQAAETAFLGEWSEYCKPRVLSFDQNGDLGCMTPAPPPPPPPAPKEEAKKPDAKNPGDEKAKPADEKAPAPTAEK